MVQGLIRRIGNGETTDIWGTNWIPRANMKRPLTSLLQHPPTKVSELIIQATSSWDEQLIRMTFIPIDAEAILQIPLCTRQTEDFWAWSEERTGKFTVRSAYRMIQQTTLSREAWLYEQGGSSHSDANSKGWSQLWGVKVPSKLKFFLWRLAHHSIPTTALLNHCNMSSISSCALCRAEDTWRHALLNCTVSRSTWALSSEAILDGLSSNTNDNAKAWLFSMHEALS